MRQSRLLSLAILMVLSLTILPMAGAAQSNNENAHLCQDPGWETLQGMDGTRFANHGECVSHAAQGGTLRLVAPDLTLTYGPVGARGSLFGTGFTPNTQIVTADAVFQPSGEFTGLLYYFEAYGLELLTDGAGAFSIMPVTVDWCYMREGWLTPSTSVDLVVVDAVGVTHTETIALEC